ncbi:hypothetical protein U1Q18_022719, partial [Sarracenia purpurea var. burkii]
MSCRPSRLKLPHLFIAIVGHESHDHTAASRVAIAPTCRLPFRVTVALNHQRRIATLIAVTRVCCASPSR